MDPARHQNTTVVICGAGMAGLATALGLARQGFRVIVCEQAATHRELGAGLWISMNGVRVLHTLGLAQELAQINLPPADRVVRLWNTGESWSVYNKQADNHQEHTLYMVLRYELHRILLQALERTQPGCVRMNHKCVGFEETGDQIRVHFAGQDAIDADVLVGADGVHSKVRDHMFGSVQQRYTQAIAWRGLAPMTRISKPYQAAIATTWIGPTAHITSYPVQHKGEQFISFSAQVDHPQWEQESWSEPGKLQDCLDDFQGWHPQVMEMIRSADILYKWGLFVRDELPCWQRGRVVLLGDACHSMVPYLGQGVNLAFEDSCVLVNVLTSGLDIPNALARYDTLRRARAYRVARASMDMLGVFHHPDLADADKALPYIQHHWGAEQVRARYDWIVGYDALQVV